LIKFFVVNILTINRVISLYAL